jgi:hypothetical protein
MRYVSGSQRRKADANLFLFMEPSQHEEVIKRSFLNLFLKPCVRIDSRRLQSRSSAIRYRT